MKYNEMFCGFRFPDEYTVEFLCDANNFLDLQSDEDVYVTGSFNGWLNTADSSWKMMKKVSKNGVSYHLTKSISDVMIPGNTGYPEFRFFAISSISSHYLVEEKVYPEFIFLRNKLILKDKAELEEIAEAKKKFVSEKKLSDFDLDCPACRADISNVRLVPGTKCLYRGYNPFKRSRTSMETEDARIELVQKAYKLYGIKSDITLNGYEGANSLEGEILPDVIKEIEANDNRICINIDYNLVYFHSDAFDYSVALQKISRFIINHPGPFYLHCRLGSDRTGVTSAVFAALCGASWEEIAFDYERTNNMGIGEYRDRKLLQYSLTKMIGKDPVHCKDLAYIVQSFFLKENILSMEEIKKLIEKLNTPSKKKETDFFDFSGNHICLHGKSAK